MPRRKKKKKKGKRHGDSSSEEEEERGGEEIGGDEPAGAAKGGHKNKSKLSFRERAALRREASNAKRRAKMKCRLCGEVGHVRRECPGIPDGGSGESRYKTKGGAGTGGAQRKDSSRGKKKKGARLRGQKRGARQDGDASDSGFVFPAAFGDVPGPGGDRKDDNVIPAAAEYPLIDCGTDISATLAHIEKIRSKKKRSDVDAVEEYKSLLRSQTLPNYKGCVTRVTLLAGFVFASSSVSWPGRAGRVKAADSRVVCGSGGRSGKRMVVMKKIATPQSQRSFQTRGATRAASSASLPS